MSTVKKIVPKIPTKPITKPGELFQFAPVGRAASPGKVSTPVRAASPKVSASGRAASPKVSASGRAASPKVTASGRAASPKVTASGRAASPKVTASGRVYNLKESEALKVKVDLVDTELRNVKHRIMEINAELESKLEEKAVEKLERELLLIKKRKKSLQVEQQELSRQQGIDAKLFSREKYVREEPARLLRSNRKKAWLKHFGILNAQKYKEEKKHIVSRQELSLDEEEMEGFFTLIPLGCAARDPLCDEDSFESEYEYKMPKRYLTLFPIPYISKILEDQPDIDVIPVKMDEESLAFILSYLHHQAGLDDDEKKFFMVEQPLRDANLVRAGVPQYDSNLVDYAEKHGCIYTLMIDSNYFEIISLLHLLCAKMASGIKGKPLEEVQEYLGVHC
jgi:hypothetical protein